MGENPRVSVLMPVYNGERYLRKAIESILNQTFVDFEFVIVDDGSLDDTWHILKDYAAQDSRIVLLRNETNIGLAGSLNKGLNLAQGEYIARMDADDISLLGRLAAQVTFLDEHPEIGVVGCAIETFDAHGHRAVRERPATHDLVLWTLCFYSALAHPTVVFRKTIVERIGGYDDSLVANQDRDLWQRLSSLTRFANLEQVYLLYRIHADSVSHRQADIQAHNSARAGQRMIASILGIQVPFQVCHNIRLWHFETADEAIQAARLIHSLCQAFMAKKSLPASDKRAIRRDASHKIIRLAEPWWPQVGTLPKFFFLMFQIDPLLASKTILDITAHKAWHFASTMIKQERTKETHIDRI